MEPNKERIEKWVAALESDEMQGRQTTGGLGTPQGSMCAAGVGVRVCQQEMTYIGVNTPTFIVGSVEAGRWYGVVEVIAEIQRLPQFCRDLQSLPIKVDEQTYELWSVNDNLKLSFREIAQLIRKQYL